MLLQSVLYQHKDFRVELILPSLTDKEIDNEPRSNKLKKYVSITTLVGM